jgi:CheY-like chemotaxis protein
MIKLKILIVDDHKQFVEAFKFMLLDYFENNIESIDIAANGQECLDILGKKFIDLIFMDIDMPVMNGIEATRMAIHQYRDLKIIALSFHSDMKYIVQMIEAGARSYIVKEEINKKSLQGIFEL